MQTKKITFLPKASLDILSDKGIIAVDNALWSGRVLDENSQDKDTQAIKKLTTSSLNNQKSMGHFYQ